jgi:hypothetical protein
MLGALLGDLTVTFAGQKASYWRDSSTVHETNRLVAPVLSRGMMPTLLLAAFGAVGLLFTASVLPKRWALILILAVTLSCYYGISSWLVSDFHLGSAAEMVGAAVFAVLLVGLGLDTRSQPESP